MKVNFYNLLLLFLIIATSRLGLSSISDIDNKNNYILISKKQKNTLSSKRKPKLRKRKDSSYAEKLIQAGKLNKAKKYLKKKLNKNTKNKKLNLLLGAVYASQQKFKLAKKYFKRSGKSYVGSKYSYLYGLSFYATKDCKRSIKGFLQVKKSRGVIYSDSRFYMGMCYFQQKRYTKSRKSFRKAKGVSNELRPIRRKMLAQVGLRQNQNIKSLKLDSNHDVLSNNPIISEEIQSQSTKNEGSKEETKPLLSHSISPSLKVSYLLSENQNHGFSTNQLQRTQLDGLLSANVKYLLKKTKSGQPFLSAKLIGSHTQKTDAGTILTNFGTADSIEVQDELSESEGSKSSAVVGVSIDYPLTASFSLKLEGEINRNFNDLSSIPFQPDQKNIGAETAKLGLNLSVENVIILSNFHYSLVHGEEAIIGSQVVFDASIIKNWDNLNLELYSQVNFSAVSDAEKKVVGPQMKLLTSAKVGWSLFDMNFSIKGSFKQNTPVENEKINSSAYGSSSIVGVDANVAKSFDIGLNLFANINYSQLSEFFLPNSDNVFSDDVNATASKIQYGAGLNFQPVSFLSIGAEYSLGNYVWNVANEIDQQIFEQKNGNIEVSYKGFVSVSHSF